MSSNANGADAPTPSARFDDYVTRYQRVDGRVANALLYGPASLTPAQRNEWARRSLELQDHVSAALAHLRPRGRLDFAERAAAFEAALGKLDSFVNNMEFYVGDDDDDACVRQSIIRAMDEIRRAV